MARSSRASCLTRVSVVVFYSIFARDMFKEMCFRRSNLFRPWDAAAAAAATDASSSSKSASSSSSSSTDSQEPSELSEHIKPRKSISPSAVQPPSSAGHETTKSKRRSAATATVPPQQPPPPLDQANLLLRDPFFRYPATLPTTTGDPTRPFGVAMPYADMAAYAQATLDMSVQNALLCDPTRGLLHGMLPADAALLEAATQAMSRSWKLKKQRPKKFQCPHCQVSFSNNGQLKGHVRIHTGKCHLRCPLTLSCCRGETRREV